MLDKQDQNYKKWAGVTCFQLEGDDNELGNPRLNCFKKGFESAARPRFQSQCVDYFTSLNFLLHL